MIEPHRRTALVIGNRISFDGAMRVSARGYPQLGHAPKDRAGPCSGHVSTFNDSRN
jgi:hypothetical protein